MAAKTYRVTIEYTTLNTSGMAVGPEHWDWGDILDLNPAYEAFTVTVDKVETNEGHVQEIMAENDFIEVQSAP